LAGYKACIRGPMTAEDTTQGGKGQQFRTTLWTQIVMPAGDPTSKAGRAALETLCRAYWGPLYGYVRGKGYSQHEAEDLTQAFFARLLQRNDIARASRQRGRFRSFLLASLQNFLTSEWRSRSAQKRGGPFQMTSFDLQQAEGHYQFQAADSAPEIIFDKHWALTVVDRVMKRLEDDYATNEKSELFAELKPFLTNNKATARAEIAKRHGITPRTVDVVIHRLRKKWKDLLRKEIEQTVAREQVEDELRYLIEVLGT